METKQGFSGRTRARKTRTSVIVADRAARALITIGGLSTILAVLGVAAFLVMVAWPLIFESSASDSSVSAFTGTRHRPVHVGVDAFRLLSWTLHEDGSIVLRRLDTGEALRELHPLGDRHPTVLSLPVQGESFAAGYEDGTAQLFTVSFATEFYETADAPGELGGLRPGEVLRHGNGLAQLTPKGQVRLQNLDVEVQPPISLGTTRPLALLDHVEQARGTIIVAMDVDQHLHLNQVRFKRNLMTGKVTARSRHAELPIPRGRDSLPSYLVLAGLGEGVALAWTDGHLLRYDTSDLKNPVIAEELEVLPPGRQLTALRPLLGRSTLLVGDSEGGLSAWFLIKPERAATPDGALLVRGHELPASGAALTTLSSSARSRMALVGDADGGLRLVQVTTEQTLLELSHQSGEPIVVAAIAPKDDAILALTASGQQSWSLEVGHPEATLSSLFLPTWYEGYEQATQSWQSSSGTDDFEVKLGLWPLIFGTIKATLYSMLFGAPIALLAAVYTSEFLPRSVTSRVKPGIELMASLPSVVLGFLAALVVAPWLEQHLSAFLATVYLLPVIILFGAHLWQLLPRDLGIRLAPWRPWACLAALLATPPLGVLFAPWLERQLLAGNLTLWLDGQTGSGTGGWMFLLVPAAALFVGTILSDFVDRNFDGFSQARTRRAAGLLALLRLTLGLLLTLMLAGLVSWILTSFGLDPRGYHVSTYVQRNALIVGFAMGFAIIPIIYTIADDALNAVPGHLRSASLGCGATPWQTAIRVVIPTAMSGLFSALMIGLGRAVGETMIVLMAAGNTPIMEWNVFNGFRTLSANIAVELPEAVRDSTHYRTLFLAALVLFALTFVVNTLAELVREHFRKRAYEA